MIDAAFSRARLRDLTGLGRAGTTRRPPVAAADPSPRFTTSTCHRGRQPRRQPAAAPQSGQSTPRAGELTASTIYDSRAVNIALREPWRIGPVEVPTRVVLAPMAGVSVQAFRRQGRRFGAGLVCSEMVSCAGIEHRNERTLGYLRVAADDH